MNALLPDLSEIEELDFTPKIPCEHSQHRLGLYGHAGPAEYLIRVLTPCGCPPPTDYFYICKGGYENPLPIRCDGCGGTFPTQQVWKIVAKVGA